MSYMFETSNLSLYGYGFSDPTILRSVYPDSDPFFYSTSSSSITHSNSSITTTSLQKKKRHDGTSPLPLGMDWSPPPTSWNGQNSVWPHDHRTGWSYCVTIPSWTIVSSSSGSNPATYYRVQVAVQSPEGSTTIRGVLRRFNNFLKLLSDLKNEFPKKNLPPAPGRSLLRVTNKGYLEERRHALEGWMEKLLSDIDVSRSVHVAIFLELEAVARSSFYATNQIDGNEDVPTNDMNSSNHSSINTDESLPKDDTSQHEHRKEHLAELNNGELSNYERTLSTESAGSDPCSVKDSKISNSEVENSSGKTSLKFSGASGSMDSLAGSDLHIPSEFLATLPSDEGHAVNRVLVAMQQKLVSANTEREVLQKRLNQEVAAKEYLKAKVNDLEVELETTKQSGNENLHQVVTNGKDKSTQMLWDADDFKRMFTELELKLKSEQDEKMLLESTKASIVQQNEIMQQELDITREKLNTLLKQHEELQLKSICDVKLLIKEVKSLRSCQLELKDEANRLIKAKFEGERNLEQKEQRRQHTSTADMKLLDQFEVLYSHLKECSINLHGEEEDKLTNDVSPPSESVDLPTTLVAEAQRLLQDVKDSKAVDVNSISDAISRTSDDESRLMLTNMLMENARLRKLITLFDGLSTHLANLLTNMRSFGFTGLAHMLPFRLEDQIEGAVGITEESLAFASNIAHHPETWLDFPLSEEEDIDDFDISDAQCKHTVAVERLVPRLAALRIELCPAHMSKGYFWKVYFVLLHSRLNRHDAELLSTQQVVEARSMWMQELQKRVKSESYQFRSSTPYARERSNSHADDYDAYSFETPKCTDSRTSSFEPTIESDIDKYPIVSCDSPTVDKSVIKEESVTQTREKEVVEGPSYNGSVQQYEDDDDEDDWLDHHSEIGGYGTPTIFFGTHEDVSFSDLEDNDDCTMPMKSKPLLNDSDTSTKAS